MSTLREIVHAVWPQLQRQSGNADALVKACEYLIQDSSTATQTHLLAAIHCFVGGAYGHCDRRAALNDAYVQIIADCEGLSPDVLSKRLLKHFEVCDQLWSDENCCGGDGTCGGDTDDGAW